MTNIVDKVCSKCKISKPLEDFAKSSKGLHGRNQSCKKCISIHESLIRSGIESHIVVNCNRIIFKRQARGTHFCLIKQADAYRKCSHMLDKFGMVIPKYKRKYSAVRKSLSAESIEKKRITAERAARLADKRKEDRRAERTVKLEAKETEKATAKAAKEAAKHSPRPVTDENIRSSLFCRIRSSQRKYARKGRCAFVLNNTRSRWDSELQSNFGYTLADLKQHIESRFCQDMDWQKFLNQDIHIDHVKPAALFDLNDREEWTRCYSLENLQPLFSDDNIKKGATFVSA